MKPDGMLWPAHAAAQRDLLRPGEVFWALDVTTDKLVRVRHRRWFGEPNGHGVLEDSRTGKSLTGCLIPVIAALD